MMMMKKSVLIPYERYEHLLTQANESVTDRSNVSDSVSSLNTVERKTAATTSPAATTSRKSAIKQTLPIECVPGGDCPAASIKPALCKDFVISYLPKRNQATTVIASLTL